MKIKTNSAFSIIEMSVVLLLIAVIVAGITQGGILSKKAKLRSAQSYTRGSVVNSTSGLVAWYETTLPESFLSTEARDNNSISLWNDLNKQSVTKSNATQSTGGNQPQYIENAFGAIPGVRFNGSSSFLNIDGLPLVNSDYTIFIVAQRRSNSSQNYFIGGTDTILNSNMHLGFRYNKMLTQGHYENNLDYAINGYSNITPSLYTFWFSQNSGKQFWINSGISSVASDSSQTTALVSYNGAAIGRFNSSYFNGDIAEIIIFNRALNTEERQDIENYLQKKYNLNFDSNTSRYCPVNLTGITSPTSVPQGSGSIFCNVKRYKGSVSYNCNNGTLSTTNNCTYSPAMKWTFVGTGYLCAGGISSHPYICGFSSDCQNITCDASYDGKYAAGYDDPSFPITTITTNTWTPVSGGYLLKWVDCYCAYIGNCTPSSTCNDPSNFYCVDNTAVSSYRIYRCDYY